MEECVEPDYKNLIFLGIGVEYQHVVNFEAGGLHGQRSMFSPTGRNMLALRAYLL